MRNFTTGFIINTHKILVFLFFLVITNVVFSQQEPVITQTIRGIVLDKTTQSPLAGASIIILDTNPILGTTSDFDGEFKLENIEIGRVSLQVSFIGFDPIVIRNILLNSGKELVLNIEMNEQAFVTEEVVIKAEQRKDETINKMATVSARSFSVEETERYAGSLGDPSRMASNFAGVSMVNDSRNDIIIRGNSPTGVLWRLDGIEIPNPNHFGAAGTTGGPVSILNNNLLTNSDFFTSAFPAEYGNAMSGVFDLKMRSGNNQKREYVGQVGFNGFELGAEGPFSKNGKSSYLINYRYSTLGLMNKIGIDMGAGAAIPQYQDLTFKLDFVGTKFGRFSIVGIGGLSFIELYDSKKEDDDSDQNYTGGGVDLDYGSDMGVLGLSHLIFFNEDTRLNTYISVQGSRGTTAIDSLKFDTKGQFINNSNYKFYDSKLTEIKYSASTHLKKRFNSRNNAVVGLFYEIYDVSYLDSSKISSPSFVGFKRNYDVEGQIPIVRAYVQWQHKFSNTLSLNSGLYSQYVQLSQEMTLEPRLGLKYNLTDKQVLSAGYGLHSQMPSRIHYFSQIQLEDGSYTQSNKNMKLAKSHQMVLSYDYLFSSNFRFKTEIYYQSLFDIAVTKSTPYFSLINSGSEFGGFFPENLESTGTGTNYGIEFTLEKFLSNNFYFLTTVSLYESNYKGYNEVGRSTVFNNNYIVNALGGYELQLGKQSSISLDIKGVYAGGKRYIPIDINQSKISGSTEYSWEQSYENRYNDYFRADIRISFKLDWKKMSQEWAIDLQNISNNQNIYAEAYNPRTQTISKDYQTGFFPMFLYRIKF